MWSDQKQVFPTEVVVLTIHREETFVDYLILGILSNNLTKFPPDMLRVWNAENMSLKDTCSNLDSNSILFNHVFGCNGFIIYPHYVTKCNRDQTLCWDEWMICVWPTGIRKATLTHSRLVTHVYVKITIALDIGLSPIRCQVSTRNNLDLPPI